MRMILVAAVAFCASPAVAQTACVALSLTDALENVQKKHGEVPLFTGKMEGGELFIVTAKQDGDRSWTVIVVPAPGVVCIPAQGLDFQPARNLRPIKGSPS